MLKAGFARVDVTPPLGTLLTGYFALRVSDGILDPIELNALAISNDEDTALLITGDFMYTLESTMTRFRKLLSLETGIPMDHIFAQSIHQHTSTTPRCYTKWGSCYRRSLSSIPRTEILRCSPHGTG